MRSLVKNAIAAWLLASIADAAPVEELVTHAERSGFQETGRYEEVVRLCAAFQKAYPKHVRAIEFGRTPEGRPMLALVASRAGTLRAAEAKKRKLPVLLVQGGIHAGEIDGKDASFLVLREALENKAPDSALEKQVLLFVPVFNVDGHERFGAWNRPNQRGPSEMGWRTTAQNYNLNRDYMKADALEMQAMLRLINEWDPLACMDLHVTDGAKFEPHISVQVEPLYAGDEELRKIGRAMRDATLADLSGREWLPLPFYPSFVTEDDPQSGFEDGVPPPRFSTTYFPLRNRFCVLVETHSWKDYPTRVRVMRDTIVSVMAQIARHGGEWAKVARDADARAAQLGGQNFPLTYKATDKAQTIPFRGYEYTRTISDISGALMTRYDESKPQVWHLPLRDDVQPALSVAASRGGYIVPVAHAGWVAEKLRQHGVAFEVQKSVLAGADVETFRATKVTFASESFEYHQTLALEGEWKPERRDLSAGALFVPIAQPKSRLVVALLEPRAPDSLAAWGEFNGAFEQKEFMEAYVAEEVAWEQLAADPSLAAEFKRGVAEDPEFAGKPTARLQFFAQRHSSWDERLNLYPVFRSAVPPAELPRK
ncbi:MAG: peptidase M14 [Verrucomicrobiota bacterium]|nr:peptidase M14 [Verrucomicrobiota bacterium]